MNFAMNLDFATSSVINSAVFSRVRSFISDMHELSYDFVCDYRDAHRAHLEIMQGQLFRQGHRLYLGWVRACARLRRLALRPARPDSVADSLAV